MSIQWLYLANLPAKRMAVCHYLPADHLLFQERSEGHLQNLDV